MKVHEILNLRSNPQYLKHWLYEKEWVRKGDLIEIGNDGRVSVDSDVLVRNITDSKLPFAFAKVTGNFTIGATASSITSFGGFPTYVGHRLDVAHAYRIKSLHNIHKHVKTIKGAFNAYSVNSNVLGLMLIKELSRVTFHPEEVMKIINKHLESDRDINLCQEDLIDAGFELYARL